MVDGLRRGFRRDRLLCLAAVGVGGVPPDLAARVGRRWCRWSRRLRQEWAEGW